MALNLAGIDRHEIRRGQAIVGREFSAQRNFSVRFVPLQSARSLVRRRTAVRAYVGAAEILGTLVTDEVSADRHEMRGQLHLREPVVAFAGVRFVLRRPSPMTLLGGGYVEGVDADHSSKGQDSDEAAVLAVLRAKGLEAAELGAISTAANLREPVARNAVERLVEQAEAICVNRPPAYVDGGVARSLCRRMLAQLDEAHRREPWAMGVTSIALARALGVQETALVRIAEHFVEEGRLVNRGGYYAALDHRPSFTSEQHAFFDRLLPIDDVQPFLPMSFAGAAAAVKLSPVLGLTKAFDTMLARGTFVKVGDDLYRGSQIAQVRARVEAHLREHERMTAAQFRDILGTSRKYAMPLLEWLDAHAVTIRNGDYRTLRHAKTPA